MNPEVESIIPSRTHSYAQYLLHPDNVRPPCRDVAIRGAHRL
jgi:hypothetical protein